MPQPQQSDSPPPAHHPPHCSACGRPMRLLSAIPSTRFTNLDICTFVCECGATADLMMARKE